jgi:4-cresol dehydrogenase (hydroxylating)
VISLSYDRRVPGEDEKAGACYRRLLQTLAEQGYYSYRLGVQGMEQMNGGKGYNLLLKAIKACIDPNNVLSPGRYIISD